MSIFHLESSYHFQAWSLFVEIVWGTVKNCNQRKYYWSTFVEWTKQRSLHWWDIWHCIVCNTDSPIHIHKFIPPEVWKAMLESTLAILQQFYIQVETQSDEFHLFAWDLSTYTLRCKRCGQHITLHGSIGEISYHAPTAMLYHWNMIEPHDEQIHRELMLMPLFAPYKNYVQSSRSYQEGWNRMEDSNICQKPTKYGQSMFCEAVRVDMENSKK